MILNFFAGKNYLYIFIYVYTRSIAYEFYNSFKRQKYLLINRSGQLKICSRHLHMMRMFNFVLHVIPRQGISASHFGNRNLIYWKPAVYRRILYLPTPGLIKALSAGTTGTTGTPGRQINRSGLPPCHLIPEPINSRSGAVFYSELSLIKNHLFVIRFLRGTDIAFSLS